jgi:hypothetical protein
MMRDDRFRGASIAAVALLSLALGCSSSTGDGNRFGELLGRALAPENGEPVALAEETVVLLTYDEDGNIVMAEVGTTDENGEFRVEVEAQPVVALVVQGTTEEGETEISGLYNPEAGMVLEKVLDPGTSIACIAGLSAVGDGSIAQQELDEQRVQNLEDASELYIEENPDFDFYSESDRDDAVDWVRTETNDGNNPAT